mgnify:CR=1 FL=1
MAKYEYSCHECKVLWECDFPFGSPESTTPCPKCNSDCGQNWLGREIPVHFKSYGFPDHDRKIAKTGGHIAGDSDEMAKELIEHSKKSMQTGNAMYQRVNFNPEGWNAEAEKLSGEDRDKAGYFKPIDSKRKQEKQDYVKNMTGHAYDKYLPEKTVGPNDPRIKQQ